MFRLVESIKVLNGELCGLEYHDRRYRAALREIFGVHDGPGLAAALSVPEHCRRGLWKCRVLYGADAVDVTFEPYRRRKIGSLMMVRCDDIDCRYKYADRTALERLHEKKELCDDILIVKNGLVADTSFTNIAFADGNRWFTPRNPLLRGTKREKLIEDGTLAEADIAPDDLARYTAASLINAMLDLGDTVVPMENIFHCGDL